MNEQRRCRAIRRSALLNVEVEAENKELRTALRAKDGEVAELKRRVANVEATLARRRASGLQIPK